MRMRLDPPEFGELDLRMTVENGNSLRLSIGTERADLRDLLLSGLDQLKKELEQSGLRVTHADVHTQQGDGSKRDFAFGQHMDQAASSEADNEPQVAARAQSGWITAQGLDFWV
jgi:flagellar hook-length control protein FliK